MKQSFIALLLLFGALGQFQCYAHSKDDHVKQMKEIFNGYDSDVQNSNDGRRKYGNEDWEEHSFYRYYERFTFELDNDKKYNKFNKPNKYTLFWHVKRRLNIADDNGVPGSHRDYGHCWIMGERTFSYDAREILRKAFKKQGLAYSNETNSLVQCAWKEFYDRQYGIANTLLGIGEDRAKAFASIVHCIHLLGDREPGNKDVNKVLKVDKLIKVISEQAKILFEEKWSEADKKRVENAAASGSEAQKAQAVLKAMTELKFGTKLHDKWGRQFENRPGCKWNPSVQSNSSSR